MHILFIHILVNILSHIFQYMKSGTPLCIIHYIVILTKSAGDQIIIFPTVQGYQH